MTEAIASDRYRVWSVEAYTADGEEKHRWQDVGASFRHRQGEGMNMSIYAGLVVTGSVVLREPRKESEEGAPAAPAADPVPNASKPLDVLLIRSFEREGQEEKRFVNVGMAFGHKDGRGFNVQLREGIGLAGGADVMLLPHKSREEREAAAKARAEPTNA